MKLRTNEKTYIGLLLATAAVAVFIGQAYWPAAWTPDNSAITAVAALLVTLALIFPIKISPQATGSLAAAPIFLAVLLLPPLQAAIAGIVGVTLSNMWLKRRGEVMLFNMAMTTIAIVVGAISFQWLTDGSETALLEGSMAAAVAFSGVAVYAVNLALTAGMVTFVKGRNFWKTWARTWAVDGIQEAGVFVLGFLGAVLGEISWWGPILLAVPLGVSIGALSRSVHEARTNIELAQKLKKQMEEMQATEAQLVESAKMATVGTLAAGVAHEISNPLFAILGRAELLLRNPDKHLASDRAREYVGSIHELATRASDIVQELLAYSRPSKAVESVRLNEILDAGVRLAGMDSGDGAIELRKDYNIVPPVQGVPNRLQQVILNVLVNARDAMPTGGTLTLKCWAESGVVKASIRDTGVGIPKENQAKIFEPFFTTKEVGKGTGLGLFMCHRIVSQHQGKIQIKSEDGQGTEVLLEFPASKVISLMPAAAGY